ncbi:uncharacterized protein LOC113150625 isoform X2 [Anabas testudineus]|uniref:uncharacterized protein LOC113150625 isoform X2 n=1 Tax=Anabas testudineus TaxID=64144 RepID=UPI000E4660C4|nr:uncharacterized protein LOC113150625 isoform X2 [Anabas testudineus]
MAGPQLLHRDPLLNTPTDSQHLSLGSSSDQRHCYDPLQVSSQSCVSSVGTLTSGNNTHHSNMFKKSHLSNNPSSTTLFTNTVIPSTSNTMSFNQQSCHGSSMPLTANPGKIVPQPSFPQQQGLQPQHLPFLSTHSPYKASFQPPVTNQGLPNGFQNLPTSLPSCGRRVSRSQAPFEGANVESAGFAGYTCNASSSSQEQPQWTPSSHSRGAVDKSIPDITAHPNNEQEGNTTPQVSSEGRRTALLRQREQLLQQLEEMDKLLASEPQDESSGEDSPITAVESASSQCDQTKTSDAQQDQSADESHSVFSEGSSSSAFYDEQEQEISDVSEDQMSTGEPEENASAKSDDDIDSVYAPPSDDNDDDAMDCPSDSDGHLSDESSHSDCSNSGDQSPTLSSKKRAKSESSLLKDKGVSPTKKIRTTDELNSSESSSEAVVLQTLNSKDDSHKRNYCLFCSRSLTKMARHLERMHSDKAEVAAAFQYPKKSRERFNIWNKLINEGNFAHNKEVLKTGKGQLAVRKRPKKDTKATDFIHCLYCRGLYRKKFFFKHLTKCPEKKSQKSQNEKRIGRKSITVQCVLEALGDIGISDGFKSILCGMIYDDVTQAIIKDKLILQFGEQMFNYYGADAKKQGYIKQNLRHLGRLVLEAAKTTPLKNLEEFFYLSSFRHVVSAVNVLAGYDSESKTYRIPSLALKLGYHLQKACSIVKDNAVKRGDDSLAKSARKFLGMYEKKWNKLISSGALTTLKETKLITDKKVPLVQDVKRLYFHVENAHLLAEKQLRQTPSAENYSALTKAILARTVLFNRRKGLEVSSIQISQFLSRKKSDVLDDMDISVSDLERTMCSVFTRVDIRGTNGRMVPVILKPSFVSALELLLDVREKCDIPSQNPFLFARPSALSAYSGTQSIGIYVKECGAKNPEALTLRKMQRHYGKMLQLMNLDENEAYQILGPNNQVQALRQNSDLELDDMEMISGGFHNVDNGEIQGDQGPHKLFTSQVNEAYGDTKKTVKSRNKGSEHMDKKKWKEAEVRAVERHMMSFIQGHKVPQKSDCFQCLEAEPHALKSRTWKGVKNYVRNRITALERQSGSSKALSTKRNRPEHVKQKHEKPSRTKAHMTTPPKSVQPKEKGPKNKDKHKWGEAEVHAVEKHMMSFIKGHKVPQKDDCVQCLEAEPHALKSRTWKGVKDYVRNRITALERQGVSPKAVTTNRNRPQQAPKIRTNINGGKQRFMLWKDT